MSILPIGPYLPTNELVAVAWLTQRAPGLGGVATTLPSDPKAWPLGFTQVQSIPGGAPDVDTPVLRHALYQVDFWAASIDAGGNVVAGKPPWGKANRLAELAVVATEEQEHGRPVELPDGYVGARVQAAYFLDLPSRVPGDPSGYARFTGNLAIDWARLPA